MLEDIPPETEIKDKIVLGSETENEVFDILLNFERYKNILEASRLGSKKIRKNNLVLKLKKKSS